MSKASLLAAVVAGISGSAFPLESFKEVYPKKTTYVPTMVGGTEEEIKAWNAEVNKKKAEKWNRQGKFR